MADNSNLLYPLFNAISDCWQSIKKMNNQLPTFVNYEISEKQYYYTDKLVIPIGVTNGNKKVYLTIGNENSTIFICGTVGSGKSVAIKTILSTVINNFPLVDLWLLDNKIVELGMFKNCKQVSVFEYDSDAIDMRLEQLLDITLDRYNFLFEQGYTNVNDYNRDNPKNKMLPILVVIEELVLLNKKSMKNLLKICSLSRGCDIWVIYSCQRVSNDIISPTIKAITNTRIVFRCENTKTSVIAMENELATELKGKGNGYLVNQNTTEFQGYFISDQQVKEICDKHKRIETKVTTNKINSNKSTDTTNINNNSDNNNNEWWLNL